MDLLLNENFGRDMLKRLGEAKAALVIADKTGLVRGPMMHFLKTWTEFFEPCADGRKRFDLRKNDRDYQVGDVLILANYDRLAKRILPGYICVEITYKLESFPGVKTGYCILGWQNNAFITQQIRDFYVFHLTNHLHNNDQESNA